VLFIASEWLAINIFKKEYMAAPFQIIAFAITPFSLAMIHAESLRAVKKITLSELIKTVTVSAVTLILLQPLVNAFDINGALVSYLIAAYVTLLLAIIFWKSSTELDAAAVDNKPPSNKELFASSLPLFYVSLTGVVQQHTAIVILGIYESTAEVGMYAISNRISLLMLFPLVSLVTIYAPKMAVMYKENNVSAVSRLSKQCSLILSIFVFPIALAIGLFAENILMMFGDSFVDGVPVLRVLLVGVVVNAMTGPVTNILMMSGHEAVVRNTAIVSALATPFLCLILIPVWGVVGAAVAASAGMSLTNILMAIQVKRRLGFVPMFVPSVQRYQR
jgi:O-antigen/teichoic acid export membrane protein